MTLAQFDRLPEAERAWWVAEHELEQDVCVHGHERAVCSDPKQSWFPQRTIDYAAMELEAANWLYDERYGGQFHDGTFENWAPKRSRLFPYGHRDGVALWVAPEDLDPDGDWL